MAPEKILQSLCYYDKRNPDYLATDEEDRSAKLKTCSCDNCFYGRTVLAEELLRVLGEAANRRVEDLEQAFEAGKETIWEDLEQTVRCAKFDSFEEWLESLPDSRQIPD